MRVAALVVVVLTIGACTPAAPGGGGSVVQPTCPSIAKWAVGDSITAGYAAIAGWPDQNPPVAPGTYANKGLGGQPYAALTYQTNLDLGVCVTNNVALPELVVIQGGANDLANHQLTVAQMQVPIQDLVAILDDMNVDYRLVSIVPIPVGADWAVYNGARLAFNSWLAATYPSKFVNCDDNLLSGTWLDPAYALGDRVHLSDAGQEALASCIQNES